MSVVFSVLAITHLVSSSVREAVANVVLAAFMIAGPVALRLTGRYQLVINGTLAFCFVLVMAIVFTDRGAGINGGTVALAEIPLFATLLGGRRVGFGWMLVTILASAGVGFAADAGLAKNTIASRAQLFNDHVVLAVVILTLYLVAALYEYARASQLVQIEKLEGEKRQTEIDKLAALAETRLARAERLAALGRVTEAAAHEINNPLAFVANNLAFLQQSVLPQDREALEDARAGVDRIARIVSNLRAYARPEGEGLRQVQMDAVLTKAIRSSHVRVERPAGLLAPVLANEARLVQVFVNLLSTIQTAAKNTSVVLSSSIADGKVVVALEVAGDDADPVAKALYSTGTADAGGFGLTVCHTILGQLGGALDVESRPRQTRALVTLPIYEGESGPRSLQPTVPAPARTKAYVLIVDDEPLVARSLQRLLRKCETVVAGSGEEALLRIENGDEFDWILCDLMMPGLSGMDVHAKLSEAHPDLAKRMVFITGGAFTESARNFRSTVKNPFLEKPVDAAQLLSLIGQPANSLRP